ncbi:Unknown protein, partial [Striga hermonthica]
RREKEIPITPPGVKIPGLTQGGSSQIRATDTGTDENESAKMTFSLGKRSEMLEQGARPPPQVEEQMVTMTRNEMQRMIAEAVAAQLKQVQVEQPRVEQPRREPPRVEQQRLELPPPNHEQQAQSNDRQIRRVEEEASSIRTANPQARDETNLYCRFHKDYGHNTDDCRHLTDEIERLIRAGHLKEFIYKDREKSSRRRERSRSPRKRARTPDKEDLPQKRGTIHMIFGGSTDGDSNRARKAYARGRHGKVEVQQVDENGPVINFGPADVGEVERPHNDALMITSQISGCEVQRVFVDTGSSVNVIFYDCLKRMELDIQLAPLHTSLFGFNGSEVAPLGETMLAVVLGKGDLRKVKMVRFVVVDVESAYNAILGRPSLNAFHAVVSTYHMKLKFLVGDQ